MLEIIFKVFNHYGIDDKSKKKRANLNKTKNKIAISAVALCELIIYIKKSILKQNIISRIVRQARFFY